MKTLIEIHALQNFVPSNLNRDDTGAPKDAIFGGTRRARVSSQCLKRAVRRHFAESIRRAGLSVEDLASRTKRIREAVTHALVVLGREEAESRAKTHSVLSAMGLAEYLLFVGQREIATLAAIIDEQWDTIPGAEDSVEGEKKTAKAKKTAVKQADPALKKALDNVFDGGKAVDIALFGRMLADMPENNQNAACQVAHAISTHAIDHEFDFYTAVDDLKPEETTGADMVGTVEFNSACFYRYAVVDWEKLKDNLQGDEELAAKGLKAFLEGFVVAEPSGKQNTFAAHNPPEFVAISVRRNAAPMNLANAFETALRPRKDESLTRKSAEELVGKAKKLRTCYGGDETTFILNPIEAACAGFGCEESSLQVVLEKTLSAVVG